MFGYKIGGLNILHLLDLTEDEFDWFILLHIIQYTCCEHLEYPFLKKKLVMYLVLACTSTSK